MIAPRMIGVGVRETYLNGEGFFSFVGVEQDATGTAEETMLACVKAIGTLKKGAVRTTNKQEAALVEMYMSGEMSYTYQKMAQIGLVKQTNFHSHTSQYGARSRGIRYLGLPLREKFQRTFEEIDSGRFTEEWQRKLSKLKFKVIKHFARPQARPTVRPT